MMSAAADDVLLCKMMCRFCGNKAACQVSLPDRRLRFLMRRSAHHSIIFP
jgi:hypothetical protein